MRDYINLEAQTIKLFYIPRPCYAYYAFIFISVPPIASDLCEAKGITRAHYDIVIFIIRTAPPTPQREALWHINIFSMTMQNAQR